MGTDYVMETVAMVLVVEVAWVLLALGAAYLWFRVRNGE